MKKSKITLLLISLLGMIGSISAYKSARHSAVNYFTTTIYCATATKTLTHAITVEQLEAGFFRYFTLVKNAKACNFYGKITSDPNQ